MVLVALPDVREDAERRARGVSVADWLDAPRPPKTREGCFGDPEREARCPALRCKYHLGRYGMAHGYACELVVADLPSEERTFELIARLNNVTLHRAVQACTDGCNKLRALPDEVQRSLGVRRRNALRP